MKFNTIIKLPFILVIKLYQWFVSPILKTNCRYLPTCSEYAIISLREHGIIKGLHLAFKRICSCHPYGGEGHDPVPKKIRKEI
jgi:hypothetical protein